MKSKSDKHAMLWGGLLILLGLLTLSETFFRLNAWVWIVVLTAAGFGVFWVYTTNRSDRWLLIPAYVMWAVAGLITIATLKFLGNFIATYVLLAIALPFFYVFWRDRTQWWALIPTYTLAAVAFMVLLININFMDGIVIAAYVMFAIAIPFGFVYFRNKKNWWALIPGGIMTVLGISFLFSGDAARFLAPLGLIVVGLWLILRRRDHKKVAEPEAKEQFSFEDDAE